jgi:hypothetical protein
LSVGTPVISSKCGGLPEIDEKAPGSLICDHKVELERILLNYDKNRYLLCLVKKVYNEYYFPRDFLKQYMNLIDVSVAFDPSNVGECSKLRTNMNVQWY